MAEYHIDWAVLHGQRQILARPLAFVTGALCIATLLAFGGRWSWACELLVNFRGHYALLLSLALLAAFALRRWRIAGAALVALGSNLWPMRSAWVQPETPVVTDARALRVVSFNINIANDDARGIAAYLDALAVDILVMQEVSPSTAEHILAQLPQLPHQYRTDRQGKWGVLILSRWPLIAPQPAVRDGVMFAARTDVDLGDRRLRLYGTHLNWPMFPASATLRNAQLEALGRELADCASACIAVGDFNVTPWSSHFRDVLQQPHVRDCAAGRGALNTWPSDLPAPLGIRIDQCLMAGAVDVADIRVGEAVGSDHRATINDVRVGSR